MPPLGGNKLLEIRKFDYTVGIRIKSLRDERHMTQALLAEKIGISGSQLSRIENGERSLTFRQALAICKVLSVPVQRLVTPLREVQQVA